MNHLQSYFDFSFERSSNEETAMTNPCLVQTEDFEHSRSSSTFPCENVSTVSTIKSKKFSFLWNINNFKEHMDRQYEFTSPLFSENVSSSGSKWRMILQPANIYPEGIHVSLRLMIVSEVHRSFSVMYSISFIDDNGKHHKLKIREKVFRRCMDFDDCPIISNINVKKKDLLAGKSLMIICEFDVLECENEDDIFNKPSEKLGNFIDKSCEASDNVNYQNKKINVPSMIQSMNDLSYSNPPQKSSASEKNVNAFIEKSSCHKTCSGDFEVPNCKTKGLEILSNDLKHLYYNTNQHDVVIYTDDGKRTAHEIILTSRSNYFKKAFLSHKDKEVNVPGLNAETLDAILYYLYTGKLKQMTENSALDLLKASKLLELPCLENMTTETFLCSRIGANNVTNVFLMAKELKIESLKNNALKFMAENREEVMKTDQWNGLMRSDPHSAAEVLLTVAYYQNKEANTA